MRHSPPISADGGNGRPARPHCQDCPHAPCPRGRRTCGFTLLELMVSMAVLLLVVVVLGQMLSQSSNLWKQGEGNKERLQDLRATVDFIAGELQSALLPINRPSKENLEFTMNPAAASGVRNKDSLFWQSPLAVDQSLGDIACIGYFIRWLGTADNPRPVLCRFYADPTDADNFLIYSKPTTWLSVLDTVAPATKARDYRGLFAENVVGLWVNLIGTNGAVLASSGTSWSSRNTASLPAAVDIGLVMLDSQSAIRLTPALQSTITGLVNSAPDAATFVTNAMANESLVPVAPGLRAYQTRISIQNGK